MNIKNFPQLCLCVSPWNRGHCIETCHKTRGQLAGQIVQKCDKDELKHKNEKKKHTSTHSFSGLLSYFET